MSRLPAAIVYTPETNIDALLSEFVARLQEQGVRVGGVVQHNLMFKEGCAEEMEFVDLLSGERYSMCQSLGSGSEACRLDTDALARAAMGVRQAVEAQVDLVVVNKFGAREAGGEGLRDEIALAVMSGLPLLTSVGERFVADWNAFTGGETTLLPANLEALSAWWKAPEK